MESMNQKKKSSIKAWIAISLSFLVLIAGILVYINSRKEDAVQKQTVTFTDVGFDTPVSFQATCSEEEFETYSQIVMDIFSEYNEYFDRYNEYEGVNNVATLNKSASLEPVEVSEPLLECLQMAIEAENLNSKFDITEGKLLSLWHDAREAEEAYVPDADEIEQAMIHTGTQGITIEGNMVSFADESISLDLGGIAKGYTAQAAADALEAAGLTSGYINAGGNVVLIGNKTDGSDWVIGIQNPSSSVSLVQFKTSTPYSIVTSGDYQRYMVVDGISYSHIIDPDNGYPAAYMHSVSVIDEDSGYADAMSTALFCMSLDDGLAFADANNLSVVWILDLDQAAQTKAQPALSTDEYAIYITQSLEGKISLSN
jgi:thiamine biosynthesis lipoprotein